MPILSLAPSDPGFGAALAGAFVPWLGHDHLSIGTRMLAERNKWGVPKILLDDPSLWRYAGSEPGEHGPEHVLEFAPQPELIIKTANFGEPFGAAERSHDFIIDGDQHRPHAHIRDAWKNRKWPSPLSTRDCLDVLVAWNADHEHSVVLPIHRVSVHISKRNYRVDAEAY